MDPQPPDATVPFPPPATPPPPPTPPPARRTWLWVLGCVGCLGVGFFAVVVLGVGGYFLSGFLGRDSGGENAKGGPDVETRAFVNSREGVTGDRAEHFVEFSFRYPASWKVVESAATPNTPNFVKVERESADGITMENFAVGWFNGPGAAGNTEALDALIAQLEPQFSKSFPGYQRTATETVQIGGRTARGIRFRAAVKSDQAGTVPLWGRLLFVPTGGQNGLALVMFATDRAKGLSGPEDVGEKGEIPVILRSFRIGGGGEAAAAGTQPAAEEPQQAAPADGSDDDPAAGEEETGEEDDSTTAPPAGAQVVFRDRDGEVGRAEPVRGASRAA